MLSITRARPIPTTAVLLAGITAFAVGFLALQPGVPRTNVHAQTDCTQPSEAGCPIALESTITASLTEGTATHNWLLNVNDSSDFTVNLTNLPGNYQLWVYAPNNDLLGLSTNDGTTDEKVQVTNQGVGVYWVTVNSQNGDANEAPYTLFSSTMARTVVVPAASYDAPATTVRTGSYRTSP